MKPSISTKWMALFVILGYCLQVHAQEVKPELTAQTNQAQLQSLLDAYNSMVAANDLNYQDAKRVIYTGLDKAGEIEILLPATLLLLDYNDLRSLQERINNPTSDAIGTSFVDVVVNSAADKLIPTYPGEAQLPPEQTTKSKFKTFLMAVVNNPVMKGLMGSNPITNVISNVIQQATAYEKPREIEICITPEQIAKAIGRKRTPGEQIKLTRSVSNSDGAPYTDDMLKDFYKSLETRVGFYREIMQHAEGVRNTNNNLKLRGYALQAQIQTGKSAILSTFRVSKDNYVAELTNLYAGHTGTYWVNNAEFKKALALANQAIEYLPLVVQLNQDIVNATINDIKGYKTILNKYSASPEMLRDAGMDGTKVNEVIKDLTQIQTNMEKYLKRDTPVAAASL